MRVNILSMAVVMSLAIGCAGTGGGNPQPCGSGSHQVLRHVVLFKFTSDTTPEQVKHIEDAFRALREKIPVIAGYEWGTDVSPEKRSEGFTHCFLVTFRTAADRDAYLPHAQHQAFVAMLKPHLDKVLVVDYWAHD